MEPKIIGTRTIKYCTDGRWTSTTATVHDDGTVILADGTVMSDAILAEKIRKENEYNRLYYQQNKERLRAQQHSYRKSLRGEQLDQYRAKASAYGKRWRAEHPHYHRDYDRAHPDRKHTGKNING